MAHLKKDNVLKKPVFLHTDSYIYFLFKIRNKKPKYNVGIVFIQVSKQVRKYKYFFYISLT